MHRRDAIQFRWVLPAIAAVMLLACSQKPVFQINYLLPQAPASHPGQQVYVTATDARGAAPFLTPAAARELRDFSGLFSLVVLRGRNTGDLVGAYEIIPLMKALCKQRLQASAVAVSDSPGMSATRLEIVLKTFQLDYADRKWVARMRYEAIAHGPDGTTRRQMADGSAERLKVWGNKEAETVVGELASDMINQLDLTRLLGGSGG